MILVIDTTSINDNKILYKDQSRTVLKLNYYAQFAIGAYIYTQEGETMEDYRSGSRHIYRAKHLFVGQNGGISVESV